MILIIEIKKQIILSANYEQKVRIVQTMFLLTNIVSATYNIKKR